jgi:hypothetical protein
MPTYTFSILEGAMTKEATSADGQGKIRAILMNLSEDEQKLLSAVLAAERNALYMQKPPDINDDLWKAVTEIIG